METGPLSGVETLSEDECWQRLSTAAVGRLAVVVAGEPDIFPVNFVVDERSIVFRTAEGTKLAALTVAPTVAFESDGLDTTAARVWSVVVKGTAVRLERFTDIYAAEELPLSSWQPGPKQWFVRISPVTVTGVTFPFERP